MSKKGEKNKHPRKRILMCHSPPPVACGSFEPVRLPRAQLGIRHPRKKQANKQTKKVAGWSL